MTTSRKRANRNPWPAALITAGAATLVMMGLGARARAAPAEGTLTRFGVEAVSFQEPLRLQASSGATDRNVANYKGLLLSVERQWRYKYDTKNGGYAAGFFLGQGQASGGSNFGASDSYKVGSVPWTIVAVEPRMIWGWSESIDLSLGVGGTYRMVTFDDSATVRASASRALNATLFLDVDVQLSEHFGAKQSLGVSTFDAGPMFRWGLTYDR